MYLKQAFQHLKSNILSFVLAESDKQSTLYMTNDRFSRAWMIKSGIYCNLPSFGDVFPINSIFDYKRRFFAKRASVDLGFL